MAFVGRWAWFGLACATGFIVGCEEAETQTATTTGANTSALAGLGAAELMRFNQGRREFLEAETPAQGLGPLFNGSSCAGCHNGGLGGPGALTVVRAACPEKDGSFSSPPGGSLVFLFTTRPDVANASLPERCHVLVRRRTTSVRGLGLIEAIPDETIRAAAAAPRPDGVGGRVAIVKSMRTGEMRVGRFGWKAQHADLDSFSGDAYRNEMGVTNELFPEENAPGGDASKLQAIDPTPDPEARQGVVSLLADFMRFSSAPAGTKPEGGDLMRGQMLFTSVGCAACHRPSYRTGSSPVAALSQKDVLLYSDLLLHDIGTGDPIAQGDARGSEYRTAPLWGQRDNIGLLHDGRAATIADAIVAHAGEAKGITDAYSKLSTEDRAALEAFVGSL